jgi:hypothetical protein
MYKIIILVNNHIIIIISAVKLQFKQTRILSRSATLEVAASNGVLLKWSVA